MITLGIDYGSTNIGIALVLTNDFGENVPLFAGTVKLDARWLKDKVETRASIRRLRRTRKTKIHRLEKLQTALISSGLKEEQASKLVRFSKRRGYKSLFGDKEIEEQPENELTYRFSREVFFSSLESEIKSIIPEPHLQSIALSICERVLNREGHILNEIRQIKIDNRGASRCSWEGCDRVTPRSENSLHEIISQQVYTVFQSTFKENPVSASILDADIDRLTEIARRLRGAAGESANDEKKVLRKKARLIMRKMKAEFFIPTEPVAPDKDKAWKYIESGIMNIMETRSGRNRYCREHSREYIKTILLGKPAPFKMTISDSDIISRREQIAYSKLWRYLEVRVLPLAPQGIDRVVVERTAFDLLAGSWKSIQKSSDQFKEEMYQQGPLYGFNNVQEMLREEFGGLCAYCGTSSTALIDRDHILPRADFFFDGYLNILPACPACNSSLKGKRSLSELSLTIHPDAYNAYDNYLKKKFSIRPMHYLHSAKKGLLNLMQDPARLWEAERYLSLIAKQYSQIVQTQRSPRPFARYLCTKISRRQGNAPKILFRSGKHTALYRSVAYPDFQKLEDKKKDTPVNHALDAILLASELPDPYPVESLNIPLSRLQNWVNSVRSKAPKAGNNGIPDCPVRDEYVEGFERTNSSGYVDVEIRSMRWNDKDSMTHKQDPYGWSEREHLPVKRISSLDLYGELMKKTGPEAARRASQIQHPGLRKFVMDAIEDDDQGRSAAKALKEWLRTSVRNSITHSKFSNHPGDVARKEELEKFIQKDDSPIPAVIGVKMFDIGVRGKIDLERLDRQTGGISHRYMTQPPNRAVAVAYPRKRDGRTDTSKPHLILFRQNQSVITEDLVAFKPLPYQLSQGTVLGNKKSKDNGWWPVFEEYLIDCGFQSYVCLTPGCVIHYQNGKNWYVRNFDQSKDFKKGRLKDIAGIRRTPFTSRFISLKELT